MLLRYWTVFEGRGAAQPAGGRGQLGGARPRRAQGLQRGPLPLLQVALRARRRAGLLLSRPCAAPRPATPFEPLLVLVGVLGASSRSSTERYEG